jgi:colanic acid/amylovoran biosynthesis protein
MNMLTLLNAAPDTGNQGVSALCHAAVAGLASRGTGLLAVADHGRGRRCAGWEHADVDLVGLTNTRRFWRSDSLRMAYLCAHLGGRASAAARAISQSRAVLDISGGDSFTDLYGPRRFRAMVLTKRLALVSGVPLILLPQKLGPFNDPANLNLAIQILRHAAAVWVRDPESFRFLQNTLGEQFDPERHRLGVDIAVTLPTQRPENIPRMLTEMLSEPRTFPLVGLNVSGLLCCDSEAARRDFGLADSHPAQIEAIARALLGTDASLKLLLVPHVHRPLGDAESDLAAANALVARLGSLADGRVHVVSGTLPAMELKWVLERLDWFAGARMHATIGAFSSGVPTLGLGYSDKTRGVFEECGIGSEVADLRCLNARQLAERTVASYLSRAPIRADLAKRVASLRARASREMDQIVRQTEV